MSDAQVVGVDGYRGGWIAAVLDGDRMHWCCHRDVGEVLDAYPDARVGIDIPIGLPVDGQRRRCDLEARDFLGAARSSIFFTPSRRIVDLWRSDARHPLHQGVARQTWNIIPKIAEVDDELRRRPAGAARVAEVHPECSFRAMAGATKAAPDPPAARLHSKRTGLGVGERWSLIRDAARLQLPDLSAAPAGPAVDDLLDAAAAAWTARRWRTESGDLIRFGTPATEEILA